MIFTENLSKTYDMAGERVNALKDATIHIKKGEFIAVTGPSGSGKSTFLNLIGCLERASSGRYTLDGEDVCRRDARALAALRGQKIGFIFQSFYLIEYLTALENVALPLYFGDTPPKTRLELAKTALDRVGLSHRWRHLPGQLSGGQQQRVAIARALVTGAPVLLADEPTGNLDAESGRHIMDLIDELNAAGSTIVLITHDEIIAARAGRRVYISDGTLIQ